MIILGIDPGTRRVGYGLVKYESGKTEFLGAGLLSIRSKNDTDALKELQSELGALIKKWRPDMLAIEKLFFVKNQKTGMRVAEARGVILATATTRRISKIREYSPNEVKSGIAGNGHADKKSIAKMVRLILKKPDLKVIDDASDALAIAIFACNDRRA